MAKKTGSIVLGSSFGKKKEELPSIHSSLSPDQRDKLSISFMKHGIKAHEDLEKPSFFKQVKTAIKSSGLFSAVSAVPGAKGIFKVELKGSGGRLAQGGVGFAVSSSS